MVFLNDYCVYSAGNKTVNRGWNLEVLALASLSEMCDMCKQKINMSKFLQTLNEFLAFMQELLIKATALL